MKVAIAWSGGKDCCLALHLVQAQGIEAVVLLTMLDGENDCSRSNGVPREILEQQAQELGLPILYINTDWESYQQNLASGLAVLKEKYQIDGCVFGDMDNQEHKDFNDALCKKSELKTLMPLWGKSRFEVYTLIRKYRIAAKLSVVRKGVQIDDLLGEDYTKLNIFSLLDRGIDICGEKGEFHTLVYDCFLFSKMISLKTGSSHQLEDINLISYELV